MHWYISAVKSTKRDLTAHLSCYITNALDAKYISPLMIEPHFLVDGLTPVIDEYDIHNPAPVNSPESVQPFYPEPLIRPYAVGSL
jgi:hypothetical protein